MTDHRSTLLIDHVASLSIRGQSDSDAADTRTLGTVKTGEAAMEHPDPLWGIL